MLYALLLGAGSLPGLGNVHWDGIQATDDCFFFSGPMDMGRDVQLGSQATIQRGQVDVIAFGRYRFQGRPGEPLVRTGRHSFSGDWVTREQIEGRFDEDGFAGTYTYRERRASDDEWGHCAITAHLSIVP